MAKKILLQKSDEVVKEERDLGPMGKMEIIISFDDQVIALSRELPQKGFDVLFNKINKYRKEEKLVSFTFQDMNVDSMVCNDETAKRLNLEDENGN